MRSDAAFHHTDENDRATINIEPGIENQRLQRIFGAAFGRRDARDDGFENVFDAETAFCADEQRVAGGNGEDGFDLFFDEFGLRGGQIDFVDDRKDGEIVACGEKSVGDGLRFNALAGVDDEQRAFASGEGAETS